MSSLSSYIKAKNIHLSNTLQLLGLLEENISKFHGKKWFLLASRNLFIFLSGYKINQMKTIQFDRVINVLSNHIKIKNF
jgi:hypothetical protein